MRYYVVVSVIHADSGRRTPVSRHNCRSLLQARTLLSEMRDMACDLAEFLPGLTAEGYEVTPVGSPLPSFAETLEASGTSPEDRDYWQSLLFQGPAPELD